MMARPSSWLRLVMSGRVLHPSQDYSDMLRLNVASLILAPDLYQVAMEYRGGLSSPWHDPMTTPALKHRVVEATAAAIIAVAKPPAVVIPIAAAKPVVGLPAHLCDAMDLAEEMHAALQDALAASPSEYDVAALLNVLEHSAMLLAKVSQLKGDVEPKGVA